MNTFEYTGIGAFMLSVFSFMYKVNKSNEKKVSGQSFERFKKEVKDDYVENKMCVKEHEHVKETLVRLEKGQGKIFDLIKNGNNVANNTN